MTFLSPDLEPSSPARPWKPGRETVFLLRLISKYCWNTSKAAFKVILQWLSFKCLQKLALNHALSISWDYITSWLINLKYESLTFYFAYFMTPLPHCMYVNLHFSTKNKIVTNSDRHISFSRNIFEELNKVIARIFIFSKPDESLLLVYYM